MPQIRVGLADDHVLVRAGIRSLLASLPDVEIVAEASNGCEAVEMVRSLHPDILLMDIGMPQVNGLEATAQLRDAASGTRVIILSMHSSEEYVLQALRVGACGYLLKDADVAELEIAVRAVARGETYLSPAVSKHLISDYVRRTGVDQGPAMRITRRQREVLQMIAEGKTTQAIAQALHLSVKTVESHRKELMDRLEIHDIAGLVRYAARMGIISLEP